MMTFTTTRPRSSATPRRLPRRRGRRVDPAAFRREARNRAVILRGLLSIAGLLAAVVVGLLWWSSASARAEAERAALEERRQGLQTELMRDEALDPEQARRLLERIAATKEVWAGARFADAIEHREAEARRVLEEASADRALQAELLAIERGITAAGQRPEAWQVLHGRVVALDERAARASDEVRARIGAAAERIDGDWFAAFVAQGTAEGVAAVEASAWLVQAVDLATDRIAQAPRRSAASPWRQRLRDLAARFDAAQERRWTPEAVAGVAWQPVPLREEEWVTSSGGNMVRSVTGDTLTVVCAGGDRARSGAVILRDRLWHDAVIRCEVRLERGCAQLLPRVHRQFLDHGGGGVAVATEPSRDVTAVPAGEAVQITATVIGGRVSATVGAAGLPPIELRITTDERRGSLGLILRPDTEIALRDLRVRRLD